MSSNEIPLVCLFANQLEKTHALKCIIKQILCTMSNWPAWLSLTLFPTYFTHPLYALFSYRVKLRFRACFSPPWFDLWWSRTGRERPDLPNGNILTLIIEMTKIIIFKANLSPQFARCKINSLKSSRHATLNIIFFVKVLLMKLW